MLLFTEGNKLLYCGKIDCWDENDCFENVNNEIKEIVSDGERIADLNWDEEGIDEILVWWHLKLKVHNFLFLLALYIKFICIIEWNGNTLAVVWE